MKKIIKEKDVNNTIKENVDNKKDRLSTKILIMFVVGVMLALLGYGIKQLFSCGLSECYLGGAGIGSLIVTLIVLAINSIKP